MIGDDGVFFVIDHNNFASGEKKCFATQLIGSNSKKFKPSPSYSPSFNEEDDDDDEIDSIVSEFSPSVSHSEEETVIVLPQPNQSHSSSEDEDNESLSVTESLDDDDNNKDEAGISVPQSNQTTIISIERRPTNISDNENESDEDEDEDINNLRLDNKGKFTTETINLDNGNGTIESDLEKDKKQQICGIEQPNKNHALFSIKKDSSAFKSPNKEIAKNSSSNEAETTSVSGSSAEESSSEDGRFGSTIFPQSPQSTTQKLLPTLRNLPPLEKSPLNIKEQLSFSSEDEESSEDENDKNVIRANSTQFEVTDCFKNVPSLSSLMMTNDKSKTQQENQKEPNARPLPIQVPKILNSDISTILSPKAVPSTSILSSQLSMNTKKPIARKIMLSVLKPEVKAKKRISVRATKMNSTINQTARNP